jgi:hypothetical protein
MRLDLALSRIKAYFFAFLTAARTRLPQIYFAEGDRR